MHNHNSEKGHDSKMMWMMVICCVAPILFITLLGSGVATVGVSKWVIFGGIAVLVIVHFFIMGRSRKCCSNKPEIIDAKDAGKDTKDENSDKTDSSKGCCH